MKDTSILNGYKYLIFGIFAQAIRDKDSAFFDTRWAKELHSGAGFYAPLKIFKELASGIVYCKACGKRIEKPIIQKNRTVFKWCDYECKKRWIKNACKYTPESYLRRNKK